MSWKCARILSNQFSLEFIAKAGNIGRGVERLPALSLRREMMATALYKLDWK